MSAERARTPRRRIVVAGVAIVVGLVLMLVMVPTVWDFMLTYRGRLPSDERKAEYAASLTRTVLPVIEDLQVEYFIDEPGCAALAYGRGDYVDGDPEHCGGSTSNPRPFDETVRTDHASVAAALRDSGTPIERTGGSFTAAELRSAFFSSDQGAPLASTWELFFLPGDARPTTSGGQVTVDTVPGMDGWWFACCSD